MREPGTAHEVGGATPIHGRRRVDLMVALVAYLGLAVAVWWGVWSTHPTSVTTCGCGDSALFLWFLDWPAVALAHGHNPFFSTAMFHPTGVNLLANTSETAIGLALAPVTWIFGPVATLNVALTLAPALSAWAMYWLVRRWVDWRPAAFAAGLLYGFSPFVLSSLADAHLMNGFLLVPPLVVGVLDELLVRQRTSAIRSGVGLGLLLVLQFFLGTELLVIMAISAVAGIGLLVAHAVVAHRDELARRWRHAVTGLAAGAALSIVLLAWPAWFALAGPAHLGGRVWPAIRPGTFGVPPASFVQLHVTAPRFVHAFHVIGGYQGGPLPQASFVGWGAVVVCASALVLWRSDRRLWFFGALTGVAVACALEAGPGPRPWDLLRHVPVVLNVLPVRFTAIVLVAMAAVVGIASDRVHTSVRRRIISGRVGWVMSACAALAVCAAALAPPASALSGEIPLTVVPVIVPRWFASAALRLPPGEVVLTYPTPLAGPQAPLAWVAVGGIHVALAGGGGPEGTRHLVEGADRGAAVLASLSSWFGGPLPTPDSSTILAVRQAIHAWGVTTVVEPYQSGLPPYALGREPALALAVLTEAVGTLPHREEGAWVWKVSSEYPKPAGAGPTESCVEGTSMSDLLAVPRCVLAHA